MQIYNRYIILLSCLYLVQCQKVEKVDEVKVTEEALDSFEVKLSELAQNKNITEAMLREALGKPISRIEIQTMGTVFYYKGEKNTYLFKIDQESGDPFVTEVNYNDIEILGVWKVRTNAEKFVPTKIWTSTQ